LSTLVDLLTQQLGSNALNSMTRELGADKTQTSAALSAAIPLLVSALARNASDPQGAHALSKALSRDHDGSVLNNVAAALGNPQLRSDGAAILGHVLGDRRDRVQSGLGRSTGLDPASAGQLLQMVAPLVLGALGKMQKERGLGASDLASMLGHEQQHIQQSAPDLMGVVGNLLDANQDGSVVDDVLRLGGTLSNLFGKKS
jgi:hypothetical protein